MNTRVTAAKSVDLLRQNMQALLKSTSQQKHEIGIVNALNALEAAVSNMEADIAQLKQQAAAIKPTP